MTERGASSSKNGHHAPPSSVASAVDVDELEPVPDPEPEPFRRPAPPKAVTQAEVHTTISRTTLRRPPGPPPTAPVPNGSTQGAVQDAPSTVQDQPPAEADRAVNVSVAQTIDPDRETLPDPADRLDGVGPVPAAEDLGQVPSAATPGRLPRGPNQVYPYVDRTVHYVMGNMCRSCMKKAVIFEDRHRCPIDLEELGLRRRTSHITKVRTKCYSKDTTIPHDLSDILPNGQCRPHWNLYQSARKRALRAEVRLTKPPGKPGRPKGSKDTKPRRRRTRVELMAERERST